MDVDEVERLYLGARYEQCRELMRLAQNAKSPAAQELLRNAGLSSSAGMTNAHGELLRREEMIRATRLEF
jgi:hypothetical protein